MPVPEHIAEPASEDLPRDEDFGDGAGASEDLRGRMAVPDRSRFGAAARIIARPNVSFFLRHSPKGWEAEKVEGVVCGVKLKGFYFLPQITMMALHPGANGIRTLGKDEGDRPELAYQRAREESEKESGGRWTWLEPFDEIPAACLPEGVAVGGYLREMPCRDPQNGQAGTHHLEAWNVPVASLPGDPQSFQFDRPKYNLWRAWLVLTAKVRAPLPQVLEKMRERARQRIERAETLPIPDAQLKARIKQAKAIAEPIVDAGVPKKAAPAAAQPVA